MELKTISQILLPDTVGRLASSDVTNAVPSCYVSRLVDGGQASTTGFLTVGDEILEVNGVDVSTRFICVSIAN